MGKDRRMKILVNFAGLSQRGSCIENKLFLKGSEESNVHCNLLVDLIMKDCNSFQYTRKKTLSEGKNIQVFFF